MLSFVHYILLALCFGVCPVLWVVSELYLRQFGQVVLTWKMTQLVYYTLGSFVVTLTLFLVGSFLFAAYLGRLEGISIVNAASDVLFTLTIDCLMGIVVAVQVYLITRNVFTQIISREGIYLHTMPRDLFQRLGFSANGAPELLRWDAIQDYYQHSDYPITRYRFIVKSNEGPYSRRELWVPFYVLTRFEALLERSLAGHQEQRERTRQTLGRTRSEE
jgi:hypothetical protein